MMKQEAAGNGRRFGAAFARDLVGPIAAALILMAAAPVAAQEFRVALSSPPNSIDPHFYNLAPNVNVSEHIFEPLVRMNADSQIVPALAESWRLVDPLTWEFKIRANAKFHDGSDVTADDIVWSFDRVPTIVNSPGRFDVYIKAITAKEVVDAKTLRFKTATPYPLMLSDLTSIFVVSRKLTTGLSTDDFNAGKGMVGSGPFKFVRFARDDRVELVRNDAYWGDKPAFEKVTLRFISQPATRVAALLAKDVDAIENVPTADIKRVREDKNLNFVSKPSYRVIYLNFDQREKSPYVTDKAGNVLEKNPLRDPKVRTAMNLAINREAIVTRIMEGMAEATNNMLPSTMFGYVPELKVVKADPEGARKLLVDAGYKDGFNLVLHGPNNRYINDGLILEAIAQMWARIGINTRVAASPMADFAPRVSIGRKDASAWLLGWGFVTGEVSYGLRALVACENKERGFGTNNGASYCNPKMDELMIKGLSEVDDAKRLALFQDAVRIVINDQAWLPLHFQSSAWAMRNDIDYAARTDERTHAHAFKMKAGR